eukprot:3115513-Amphidinium_carterae.1
MDLVSTWELWKQARGEVPFRENFGGWKPAESKVHPLPQIQLMLGLGVTRPGCGMRGTQPTSGKETRQQASSRLIVAVVMSTLLSFGVIRTEFGMGVPQPSEGAGSTFSM